MDWGALSLLSMVGGAGVTGLLSSVLTGPVGGVGLLVLYAGMVLTPLTVHIATTARRRRADRR